MSCFSHSRCAAAEACSRLGGVKARRLEASVPSMQIWVFIFMPLISMPVSQRPASMCGPAGWADTTNGMPSRTPAAISKGFDTRNGRDMAGLLLLAPARSVWRKALQRREGARA